MNRTYSIINQYGQGLVSNSHVISYYSSLPKIERDEFREIMVDLIIQSKCIESDIVPAIIESGLKPTNTCCVIIKKGLYYTNLIRLFNLPDINQSLSFLLSLYRIGYTRRKEEPRSGSKWWYQRICITDE